MGLMSLFFGGKKEPEQIINEGLRHIRDLYGEIMNLERKIADDVSHFFNYEGRESRFVRDVNSLKGFSKEHRLKKARELVEREHKLLGHETNILDEIRGRLRKVVKLVDRQLREIDRIEKRL